MRSTVLLKKLWLDKVEFITSEELEAYCKPMRLEYVAIVRHFMIMGYLVRILRGIFYLKSPEELKLGSLKYSYLELMSRGLGLKGVNNWYFGLHAALKLNNMTHEMFNVEEVVNDRISRPKPITSVGHSFRFIKISPKLLDFGIITKGNIKYSDPEKTIADFVYLMRYNGASDLKISADVSDWTSGISEEKLMNYSGKYPKVVTKIIRGMLDES